MKPVRFDVVGVIETPKRRMNMIELNDELRQAIGEHPDEPVRIIDAATQKVFVLVTSEVYERLKNLLTDDFSPHTGMAMMNSAMADDDKDDPLLQSYQPVTS